MAGTKESAPSNKNRITNLPRKEMKMATSVQSLVYNHDVAGLHRRMNRFIGEMAACASTNLSQLSDFDRTRLQTYLDAVRTYVAWVVAQPQLDLPETSPRSYPLEPDAVIPVVENEALIDIMNLLQLARDETVNGQSARMPAGLIKFDVSRLSAVIDKVDAFLTQYVAIVTPLDLPETSPQRAITAPGRTGV
jgi:hypothetical protein